MEIQSCGESIIQHHMRNKILISWHPQGCPLSQLNSPGLYEHTNEDSDRTGWIGKLPVEDSHNMQKNTKLFV